MADERQQAFAMFAEGETTSAVAKKLFNKNYNKAKKLREEYDAEQGGGSG